MKITIIGIGPGHPDQITVQAVRALNAHRVILLPTKEATTTGDTRRVIAQRHLDDPQAHELIDVPMPQVRDRPTGEYTASVGTFRDRQAEAFARALDTVNDDAVAILAWGCPTLFDGTIDGVRAYPGAEITVIPGVTSVSALAAAHGVSQTSIGQSVLITTGRRLKDGLPEGHGTIVDMVDAKGHVWQLDGPDWTAYWGAFVGLPEEQLIQGPLPVVREEITRTRTALTQDHGWLFDIALLKRTNGPAHA